MNDLIISPSTMRADFERVIADFAGHVNSTPDSVKANYVFQPCRAIISQALSTATNSYQFDPWKSPSGLNNKDERKLDKNSWLYVTGIGLWIAQYDPTSGAEDWSYRSYSFPDTNVFVKAGEAAAVRRVWAGLLSLGTGAQNRFQDLHTSYFLDAPMTQSYVPAGGVAVFGEFHNDASIKEFAPNLILDGSQDNIFTLTLGTGPSTNIDGSSTGALRNRVKLVLQGIEVKNAVNAGAQCKGTV